MGSTESRQKILITDRFAQSARLSLESTGRFVVTQTENPSLDGVDLSDYAGLIVRSKTQISREVLMRAKKLQVLVTATSGFDHLDIKSCQDWGVTVMHTPETQVNSVAELTWSLVLACSRRLLPAHGQVLGGKWQREFLTAQDLAGKTFGVVGLGRIGSRVARIARAFDMECVAFDPYVDEQAFRETSCERVSYEELLKQSDVISFHVPLTEETTRMLNRSHFEYINRGVILINTSRGQVIAEQNLIEALEQGWVGACGLDVFEKEPVNPQSGLIKFSQCVFSPHIGASSKEAFETASQDAAEKIMAFFHNGATRDTLPPKGPWYRASFARAMR